MTHIHAVPELTPDEIIAIERKVLRQGWTLKGYQEAWGHPHAYIVANDKDGSTHYLTAEFIKYETK